MFKRRNAALLVGEFLGTAILTYVALEMSYGMGYGQAGLIYFIAIGVGLAVALSGLAIMGTLGAGGVQFNPALTFALWTTRQVKTLKAAAYIAAQLLGGWAAYGLYSYLHTSAVPSLGTSFDSHALVAVAAGTFVFSFIASGALFQRLNGVVQSAIVGGAYVVGVFVASTIILNPAMALGMNGWNWGVYVLGPVLGAIIGVNLYALLFAGQKVLGVMAGSSSAAVKSSSAKATSTTTRAKKPAAKSKAKKTTKRSK